MSQQDIDLQKMSHGVHIQVTIPSGEPEEIKDLARRFLTTGEDVPWVHKLLEDVNSTELVPGAFEAFEFLNDLQEGKCFFKWGNEGDIILWGMVGNHSEPLAFAERLSPFWGRLFDVKHPLVNHDWQHVLIIYTHSCMEPSSGVIEVGWPSGDEVGTQLKITHTAHAGFTCL